VGSSGPLSLESLRARPLIVTGMHRSGTSLVASLVEAAGVSMGQRLIGPGQGNPKGHFEDAEFVHFHEELLRRNDPAGTSLWLPPETLVVGDDDRRRARALGEARSRPSPWGWKDPRTVLVLDLWSGLFPEGKFLFVFRDPAQVIDSLRARRDRQLMVVLVGRSLTPSGRRWGPFRYRRALDSWLAYNRRILSFVRRFPERSRLVDIDVLLQRPEPILEWAAERLGAPLQRVDLSRLYDPTLMSRVASRRAERAVAARSDVLELRVELGRTGSFGQ